ncbi:MAG TPA: hypothetical protein VGM17_02495 [Rhizomicrobium sp.]|jgi:hypothetical protein
MSRRAGAAAAAPKARARRATVSKADLDKLAGFAQAMGLEVAAVEATPGKVRLITTAGKGLTVPDDGANLDAELEEWRARNGDGEP